MPRASRKRYLSLRKPYEPQNLRLVIVGESPPASGRYFYDPSGSIGRPLFKAMMESIGFRSISKEQGLREFQRQGWLLIDATYEPVNDLSKSERDAIIARDFDLLCEDLQTITPDRRIPIILIKKNVCRILNSRLLLRGFTVLNAGRSVYFPSHGRQVEFKHQFAEILTQFSIFPIPAERPPRSKSELTMQEDIALGLVFERVGEDRYNRTMEDYAAIAAALQSRSRKSAQDDKWSFCLTAGTLCPSYQERP